MTKSIKDMKERTILEIGPPAKCANCGYTHEKMREEFDIAWLEHRIPNTSFVFYVCPNCYLCSGNKFAVENAKKIRAQNGKGESKIVEAKTKIFLPGQN